MRKTNNQGFIMSAITSLSVPSVVSRRIEKLAQDAGRTPLQVLKFVLRDGLEYTQYAIKQANAGLAELDAGKTMTLDAVKQRAQSRHQQRAAR
jgi:predicted transcriptional regulator